MTAMTRKQKAEAEECLAALAELQRKFWDAATKCEELLGVHDIDLTRDLGDMTVESILEDYGD